MKKHIVIIACLALLGQGIAQTGHIRRLSSSQQDSITITPALAKEMLLYTFVGINDTAFFLESNNYCIEVDWDCIYDEYEHDDGNTCFFSSAEYTDGLKAIVDEEYNSKTAFKWGFADSTGRKVVPYRYGAVSDFKNGYAIVSNNTPESYYSTAYARLYSMADNNYDERGRYTGSAYALINKQGRVCIPYKKFDILAAGVYEGLIPVCKARKWGYASPDGVVRIKLQFDEARRFSEGLAPVKKDGKWGYIDSKGVVQIPFLFDEAFAFAKGVAVVRQGNFCYGLVNHAGRTTFDYLKSDSLGGVQILTYDGPHRDAASGLDGRARFTYYMLDGRRIMHGYYAFNCPTYRVDGHYNDGLKAGTWVQEWNSYTADDTTFHLFDHNDAYVDRMVIVDYADGVAEGNYILHEHWMESDDVDGWRELTGDCVNGKAKDNLQYNYQPINLDSEGRLDGELTMSNYGNTEHLDVDLHFTFFRGAPVLVEESDMGYSDRRRTIYRIEGFDGAGNVVDTLVGKDNLPCCIIGSSVYCLEPMTAANLGSILNLDRYSSNLRNDLLTLLTMPSSWVVTDVQSPQANYLRQLTDNDLLELTYGQYGHLFESKSAFRQAYSSGHKEFLATVERLKAEKKDRVWRQNAYLFCNADDFETCYANGEEAFGSETAARIQLYNESFRPNTDWFVDFCECLTISRTGTYAVAQEVTRRRELYDTVGLHFIGPADFLAVCRQGDAALAAEVQLRDSLYNTSRDPFNDSLVFASRMEFLLSYTQGNLEKEVADHKQATQSRYYSRYSSYFPSSLVFDNYYRQGRTAFMQEAVSREFAYSVEAYKSLKLKKARQSTKEAVIGYLSHVNNCVARSPEAYPVIVRQMLENNKQLSREWQKNGRYFQDAVEFYEAYIGADYKAELKSRKQR